jgi:Outer membrane protein beta-barrel domain
VSLRFVPLALTLAAIVPTESARAQPQAGRLELSGLVGAMSSSQDLGSTSNIYMTVSGAAENVSFGKLFGLRASWAFSRNLAAELEVARATHPYSLSVDDTEAGTASLGEQFDARETFLTGSLVAQFPLRMGLVPYGTVGVGRLATQPSSPIQDLGQVNATDVSFGGGVKYWLPGVRFLGLRFEARYHKATKGLTFPGGDGKPSGTELTVGGIVRLF